MGELALVTGKVSGNVETLILPEKDCHDGHFAGASIVSSVIQFFGLHAPSVETNQYLRLALL